MPNLHVISLDRGEGRTTLAAGLAALLVSRRGKAGYLKPVAIDDGVPDPDAAFAGFEPPVSASADDLGAGLGRQAEAVGKALRQAAATGTDLVIEGLPAGGTLAAASAELASVVDAPVVAIVRYRRDVDLDAIAGLKATFGERLLGVVLNAVPPTSARMARDEAAPELARRGAEVLGAIPEDRRLLSFSVQDYADALEGEVLNAGEHTGELIEHVLLGAMIVDASGPYYDRYDNKALVTRTDRPDLQWNAINEHTKCLILTGGGSPIAYVRDKAGAFDVPLVVVPTHTPETIDGIAAFAATPRFHYPQKLERAAELIERHLDLAKLGF